MSSFLNVGSAAVNLRGVCQSAGVCGLGYKIERRKQEVRIEEKPHHGTQARRKPILGKQVISRCQLYKSEVITD